MKEILQYEKILQDKKSLDKSKEFAQYKIQEIMSALSFEEILEIDDFIMKHQGGQNN